MIGPADGHSKIKTVVPKTGKDVESKADKNPSPTGDKSYASADESISEAPNDFTGHQGPDYDHDGGISDAEASAYHDMVNERKYNANLKADHETDIFREEGKNYRAQIAATSQMYGAQHHGKSHKGHGGPLPELAEPPKPEAS